MLPSLKGWGRAILLKESNWAFLSAVIIYFCLAFCLQCLGKSTLACSLSRELYTRGKLSYILDGDNLRHGLNKDLGFKADDRTENIRRVGKYALEKVEVSGV